MMKKSFRDPVTNVLKASGYCEVNAPGDLARNESEDFNLEPGRWRLEGDQWVPYEPIIVPQSVSPLQARKALRQQNALSDVQAAVSAADAVTQDAWEYATSFDRNSPFVLNMAAVLGWTDAKLDELFILAATL